MECSFPRSVQGWLPLDLQSSTSVSSLERPSLKWSLLHPLVTAHHIPAFMSFIAHIHFCCSVAKWCPILCDHMDCSTPGFLSFTISWSLLKFMSTELVRLSNHLSLYHPLLLLPSHSKCFFSPLLMYLFIECVFSPLA